MDKYIGLILDRLEELGLAEDTLVVFTSDHGQFFGQHGLIAKGPFHYEDMIRVPMILRWPGRCEAGHADMADARLRPAGDHDVRIAAQNEVRGIADGVRPRRARSHDRMIGPAKSVSDRDVARSQVDQARRDEERAEPPRALFVDQDRRRHDFSHEEGC